MKRQDKIELLVLYATGGGSTAGIVDIIAQQYRDVANVTVHRLEREHSNWPDPSRFDAVIAGSAIRYDRWLPQMTEYIRRNELKLAHRPVAFFFSCLSLAGGERGRHQAETYAGKIQNLVVYEPLEIQGFAGTLNYNSIPMWIRLPFRIGMKIKGLKEGDYRDPDAIRLWADGLKARIIPGTNPYQVKKGPPVNHPPEESPASI